MRPYSDYHRSNLPFFWDEDGEWDFEASYASGLTIYEDKNHVVIEAAVPGIPAKKIQLSHHHGYIIIEGAKEEEEKDPERQYHRKASRSFAYRVPVPPSADESHEPQATVKNGVMTIKFKKSQKKGKSIPIKEEK